MGQNEGWWARKTPAGSAAVHLRDPPWIARARVFMARARQNEWTPTPGHFPLLHHVATNSNNPHKQQQQLNK